jgi:hypothetical protein
LKKELHILFSILPQKNVLYFFTSEGFPGPPTLPVFVWAGMDIGVCVNVPLVYPDVMSWKRKREREAQYVFTRPYFSFFKGKRENIFVFLFCFWLDRTTEFPHCREGRPPTSQERLPPPLKTHALFLYENSWQLHHVMFIVSFSAFIFEIPARLKCFQKENQIKSLLNDGTDSPLFGRPAAVR